MNYKNCENLIYRLESDMWEAAFNRDMDTFKKLVAEDAVMICGGYRCLGIEYAGYIKDFYIKGYEIKNNEVILLNEDAVQILYNIEVEAEADPQNDLAGTFHVVSLWKKVNNDWKLYFNMDSRIME